MDGGGFFFMTAWIKELGQRNGFTHTYTNTSAQRPVFSAERNWLVNAKFLLNVGCQLKRKKTEVILKKPIVHLLTYGARNS